MAGTPPLRDRWIDWVLRRHRAILVVATLFTALAAIVAANLQVDSDLRRLLPRDHEVVVALEETFGSTGSVNVVVKGESEARRAYSDALAEHLRGHALLYFRLTARADGAPRFSQLRSLNCAPHTTPQRNRNRNRIDSRL